MKTDPAFLEIFTVNPARFAELADRALPTFRSAKSETQKKTLQVTCDMLFEPVNPTEPHWLGEMQMYFDHSIFNRTELARPMVWQNINQTSDCLKKSYTPREVRAMVIFGDRSMLPPIPVVNPHAHIEYLFLNELIEQLQKRKGLRKHR